MSSSIDDISCPECGHTARREQDTDTCEVHIHCTKCGYDSDLDLLADELDEDDFFFDDDDDWDDDDLYEDY